MVTAPAFTASSVAVVTVGTVAWRAGGADALTLVAEATFGWVHGGVARLLASRPIARESLLPHAPGASVVLVGHAWAPEGRPTSRAAVRLGVVRGERVVLDKSVHVLGDRASLDAPPETFERMPLGWVRADAAGRAPPNLVDANDPRRATAFGPLPPHSPERLRWLGHVPLASVTLPEVPAGIDHRFFHTAPPDQLVDVLEGDEHLVLDGMHRSLPRTWTKLPGLWPKARWVPTGGAPLAVALKLETLAIDADLLVCTLTWRGTIQVEDAKPRGRSDASLVPRAELPRAHVNDLAEPPAGAWVRSSVEPTSGALSEGRRTVAIDARSVIERPAVPFSGTTFKAAPSTASSDTRPPPTMAPPRIASETIAPPRPVDREEGPELHTLAATGRELVGRPVAPFPVAEPRTTDPGAGPLPLPGAPWNAPTPTSGSEEGDERTITGAGLLDDRPIAPFSLARPRPAAGAPPPAPAPLPGAPWSSEPAAKLRFDEEGPGSLTISTDGTTEDALPPQPAPPLPPPEPAVARPVDASRETALLMKGLAGVSLGSRAEPGRVEPAPPPHVDPPALVVVPPPEMVVVSAPAARLELIGRVLGGADEPPVATRPASLGEPSASPLPALYAPEPPPAPSPEQPLPKVPVTLRDKVMAALAAGQLLRGMDLARADLRGVDFTGATLNGCRMAGADLTGCSLRDAKLADADLAGAQLGGADLSRADLTRADLSRARGEGAAFTGATGDRVRFVGGTFDGASFEAFAATNADFTGASIAKAHFEDAELVDANLEGAKGEGAVFDRASMPNVRAESASFVRASFVDIVAQDAHWERAALEGARFERAELARCNFERATLAKASFRSATLEKATLTHLSAEDAVLDGANLDGVDLRSSRLLGVSAEKTKLRGIIAVRVDLSRAKLAGADLTGANLRTAKLVDAQLQGACLDGADLRDADLTRADLTGASRANAKLQGAKLKDAKGAGP